MKVKELRKILESANDDDAVIIWAATENDYNPHYVDETNIRVHGNAVHIDIDTREE